MFYCHIDGRLGKGFPLELAEEEAISAAKEMIDRMRSV
jgi:hypothetical protein